MDLGTQTHLPSLRKLLEYRRHELETEVHAMAMERQPIGVGGEVSDRKDEASRAAAGDVDEAEERLRLAELHEVREALLRMDAGTYGDCLECAEPIPLQRLLVVPAARRCTACQSIGERGVA